jgi:cytidine deaminase
MEPELSRQELRAEAHRAIEQAYAPYSGFRVGAAVETSDGSIHGGCNVENASFSVTMCAERVALGTAVRAGGRSLRAVYICSDSEEPVPPCGVCRQALSEFGPDVLIVSEGRSGRTREWRLSELLPAQFRLEEHATRDVDRAVPEERS